MFGNVMLNYNCNLESLKNSGIETQPNLVRGWLHVRDFMCDLL
jgi:hypothetical protein